MAKHKKHKKHSKLKLTLKILLFIILLTSLFLTLFLYIKYGDDIANAKKEAASIVESSSPDTFRAVETSLVFDDQGKQIAVLKGDKDIYYVTIDQIPECIKDAAIVTEDRQFSSHNGVNYKSMFAAAFSYIKNRGQIRRGGSTITQQLVKNVFLSQEQTLSRKIKEMFIARELEKKYSKDQILEYYLNNIYYANGYYGIEAASRGYFNKKCSELSLGEAMFLSSIPNSPVRYDPLVNFDNTIERKNRILDQMYAAEKISKEDYDEAYNTKIALNIPKQKKRNYIETYAMYCTIRALMKARGFEFKTTFRSDKEKNAYLEDYSEAYALCQQSVFRSGYRIYTSINRKKQKLLQSTINAQLQGDRSKNMDGIYSFQGSGVCIDNYTGKVVSIVGGRSQSIDGYTFNRAFQSFRQPGSSIKPILVYTPAFEKDYSPSDIVEDEAIKDGPKNSNGKYMGKITIRQAVWYSTNTVAWNMLNELSPGKCLNYLLDMGFSKISKSDYNLAAALGGFTNGVSPLEMASAYATIANSGVFNEPTCIVKITDSDGHVIADEDTFDKKKIYRSSATDAMTDVLRGVLTEGTGRGFALSYMPCAGKTGTTNDKKDGWFAGYTPYYTTVIWVGYDIPKSREDLLGNTYPARIWHDFMESIHQGLLPIDFPEYEDSSETSVTNDTQKEPEETETPDDTDSGEDEYPTDDPAYNPNQPSGSDPSNPDGTSSNNTDNTEPSTLDDSSTNAEMPVSEPDGSDNTGNDSVNQE